MTQTTDRLGDDLRSHAAKSNDGFLRGYALQAADLLQSLSTDLDKAQQRIAELEGAFGAYFAAKDAVAEYTDGRDRRPPIVGLYALKQAEADARAALNQPKESGHD